MERGGRGAAQRLQEGQRRVQVVDRMADVRQVAAQVVRNLATLCGTQALLNQS